MKRFKNCELGTEIQTLIFSKDIFTEKKAKKWAEKHDFNYGFVDEKENTFRIRQQEPDEFEDGSLRTIELTEGVKAVIGCPVDSLEYSDGGEVDYSFDYQMLSRLQLDNDAYLSGVRGENQLWAGSVDEQIKEMKRIWNKLPEKPEWLSMDDILEYEKKMTETYADGGDVTNYTEAEKWWGNDLSLNEQKEYAKKHLQSFEYDELLGSTSKYSTRDRRQKFINEIWEKEGSPKSILKGIYEEGGKIYEGFDIINQYRGKNITGEKLFNSWNVKQWKHFCYDHQIPDKYSVGYDYDELPDYIQEKISLHAKMGQYAEGGSVNEDKTRIAKEIVNQLGGMGRLNAMTGAYNFIALPNGVSFRLKNPKANYVKITLSSLDLYDLEVGRIRGNNYKVVEEKSGLYADMLKQAIERATGMYLSLAEGGSVDEYKHSLEIIAEKAENEILYLKELKYDLENKRIKPSKIIGTGFKPQYARKLAFDYLDKRISEEEESYQYYKNLLNDYNNGKNIFLYYVEGKPVIREKIEDGYVQVKYINGMNGTFKIETLEAKKEYPKTEAESQKENIEMSEEEQISEAIKAFELLLEIEPNNESYKTELESLKRKLNKEDSSFENGGDVLIGGKSDYMSLEQIAEKHNVPLYLIQKQYLIGLKIELEHTKDKKIASEIAKDHLFEYPTYYTSLVNMETSLDKMYALGGRVSEEDDDGFWIEVFDAEEYNFVREFLVNNGIRYLEAPASNVNRKRMIFSDERDFDKAVIFLNDYIKNKETQQLDFTPPQNMSELKRVLNVGFKLKVVYHRVPKEIGTLRQVAIKQTNAVAFKDLTNPNRDLIWLEYPKASSVEFGEKGFTIYFKDDPTTKLVQYEYDLDLPKNIPENEVDDVVIERFDSDEEGYMGKRMLSYLELLK